MILLWHINTTNNHKILLEQHCRSEEATDAVGGKYFNQLTSLCEESDSCQIQSCLTIYIRITIGRSHAPCSEIDQKLSFLFLASLTFFTVNVNSATQQSTIQQLYSFTLIPFVILRYESIHQLYSPYRYYYFNPLKHGCCREDSAHDRGHGT